jgi:FixJ family two-component response regulator
MRSSGPVVFVIDDDAPMRAAISSLVRSAGFEVQAFESAGRFLELERIESPACLVLDVQLPGQSGLDLQTRLAAASEQIPIIFITGYADVATSVRAMKAGAMEFLCKPFRDEELLDAVDLALKRSQALIARRAQVREIQQRCDSLTPREHEVMTRVLKGMLNKQIAAALGISEITVKVHRHNMMQKMCASSVAELVRMSERLHGS